MSNPETVTLHDIPWEAVVAMANLPFTNREIDPIIEACREATTPKPRFVVVANEWWWLIRDTKTGQQEAEFRMTRFTKKQVKAICDKLNEGETE